MCALAYVIRIEEVQAQANAMLTGALVARALGADAEFDPEQARADFDAALRAEPVAPDDRAILLEALGLRDRRG